MRAFLAALTVAFLLGPACSDSAPNPQGDAPFPGAGLLLISVDTLRADRLGAYGYERGTTPNLDALAEESVLFMDMYSNSPKTASAHMSLFTSLLPTVHKVRNQSMRLGLITPILASNRLTIAQVLNRAGYWTAAIAGGGNVQPNMGFSRGFQRRFESILMDVEFVVDRVLERFEEASEDAPDQPPFVFMHTYQVHGPYLPPGDFEQRFAPDPSPIIGRRVARYRDLPFQQQWGIMNKSRDGGQTKAFWDGKDDFDEREAQYLSDLYDGEVAYTDSQLGFLIDALRESGQLDKMIVVVLADHGEEFGEHGDFEHDQLYTEHLHVPCIIRLPGGAFGGTKVHGMASLIDVMPTLLELLDLEGPSTMAGTSLVDAMRTGSTSNQAVVSERVMFPTDYKATLRTVGASVIFHAAESRLDAFDLANDPGEQLDVYGTAPFSRPAAAELKRAIGQAFQHQAALDEVDAGGELVVDESQLAELRALGYVDVDVGSLEGTPLEHWPDDG